MEPKADLSVTIVQPDSVWQAPEVNRRNIAERISTLNNPTDIIILPEMFTAGFSMNVDEVAEPPEGDTFVWMKALAQKTGAVICGSYAVKEHPAQSKPFNRLVWMRPDGTSAHYDKRHLFRMGDEHKRYSAGQTSLLVNVNGWRINPMVCYDLRFPVWCRNKSHYDLMIFVANWPAARAYHWRQLLIARAIENQAYVVGVNRVGADGKGLHYSGDSLFIDAQGGIQKDAGNQETIVTSVFSAKALTDYRHRFPAYMDADKFELI